MTQTSPLREVVRGDQSPERVTGLERSDELDGGDVLPGFRLPVTALFEAVRKPAEGRDGDANHQT